MMVWLRMGGGGMEGAESGAGQSQLLWHSLAWEEALDDLSPASLGCVLSPASLGCVPRTASFAVPGVRGKI